MHQQTLRLREKVLGKEHLDTLEGVSGLALTWKSQGQEEMTINMMRDVVQPRGEILGANYPGTKASAKTLNEWLRRGQRRLRVGFASSCLLGFLAVQ
jgi:hypothetical protein